MPVIQPMELDIDKRDWEILLDSDEYDTTRGGRIRQRYFRSVLIGEGSDAEHPLENDSEI